MQYIFLLFLHFIGIYIIVEIITTNNRFFVVLFAILRYSCIFCIKVFFFTTIFFLSITKKKQFSVKRKTKQKIERNFVFQLAQLYWQWVTFWLTRFTRIRSECELKIKSRRSFCIKWSMVTKAFAKSLSMSILTIKLMDVII